MISGGQVGLPGLPGGPLGGAPGMSGMPGMPGQPGMQGMPGMPGQPGMQTAPTTPGQQGAVPDPAAPAQTQSQEGGINVDTFCANLNDDEEHKCRGYVESGMAAAIFYRYPFVMTQSYVVQLYNQYHTGMLPKNREFIQDLNRKDLLVPVLNGEVSLMPPVDPQMKTHVNLKIYAGQIGALPLLDLMAVAGAFECGGVDWYCWSSEYNAAIVQIATHQQPVHENLLQLGLCEAVFESLQKAGERAENDDIARSALAGAAKLGRECGQLEGLHAKETMIAAALPGGKIELDEFMRRGQKDVNPPVISDGGDPTPRAPRRTKPRSTEGDDHAAAPPAQPGDSF